MLRVLGKALAPRALEKEKVKVLEKAKAKDSWQSKTKMKKAVKMIRIRQKSLQKKKKEEGFKKGRKARDELAKAKANLEEALGKAKPSMSSEGRASAEGWKVELAKLHKKIQDALHKGTATSVAWQNLLADGAKLVKNAKDETKELNHIGNNAASTTSKGPRGASSCFGKGSSLWERASFGFLEKAITSAILENDSP